MPGAARHGVRREVSSDALKVGARPAVQAFGFLGSAFCVEGDDEGYDLGRGRIGARPAVASGGGFIAAVRGRSRRMKNRQASSMSRSASVGAVQEQSCTSAMSEA